MDHHADSESSPLPPGCLFHPSEEQLLRYYLLGKNSNDETGDRRGFGVIKEADVYKYNPFELPEAWSYCYGFKGRKRHWYGYCGRVLKNRIVRRTEGGFWKRKGRVREVVSRSHNKGDGVLGTRVSFVFYLGNLAEDAVRTIWHMHEYALIDVGPKSKAYVLCRVFVKCCHGHASNACERALCAGKNVSAVRHIGVQHDETISSDIEGPKECDNNCVDRGIQTSSVSSGKVKEDDDDMNDPGIVSTPHSHFQTGSHLPNYRVGSSMAEHEKSSNGSTIKDYLSSDDLTAQELNYILEGDYLELNDLLSPLPGNDVT